MPQIIAWKCPSTKKVFTDKVKYQKHLRKLASERYYKRTKDKFRDKAKQYIQSTLRRASSFVEIEEWFRDPVNQTFLLEKMNRLDALYNRYNKPTAHFRLIDFKLHNMRWSDSCSNSHCAPDDKPTNWSRDEKLPLSYPGWKGELEFIYTGDGGFSTDFLFLTGIYSGSGSGTNGENIAGEDCCKYRSQITIFADDFPAMAIMDKLKQNY